MSRLSDKAKKMLGENRSTRRWNRLMAVIGVVVAVASCTALINGAVALTGDGGLFDNDDPIIAISDATIEHPGWVPQEETYEPSSSGTATTSNAGSTESGTTSDQSSVAVDGSATDASTSEAKAFSPQLMDASESSTATVSATSDSSSGTDLTNYITDKTKVEKETSQGRVEANEFTDGDQVRVTIDYVLPAGTVTDDSLASRTVYYQIPDGIKIDKTETGPTTYNGKEIGTYTIDADTGIVTVVYNESAASQGKSIQGTIIFKGTATNTTTKDKNVVIGNGAATLVVHPQENNVDDGHDIKTTKASTLNADAGTIDYTVTVSSNQGTGSTVNIEDYFPTQQTNAKPAYQQGSFVLKKVDASGNETVVSATPTFGKLQDGSDSFKYSDLPALGVGEKYIVTYAADANITQGVNSFDVSNSSGSWSGRHSSWTSNNVTMEKDIQKSGTYDKTTGLVFWRILVNPNGKDVSGWHVYDSLPSGCTTNGGYYVYSDDGGTRDIIDNPSSYGESTIDYTFPTNLTPEQKTKKYYIDFWTTAPADNTTLNNTATVNKNGQGSESDNVDTPVEHRTFDVNKTFGSDAVKLNNHTLTWNTVVTVPDTELTTFEYTDTLGNAVDSAGNDHGSDSHYALASELENYFAGRDSAGQLTQNRLILKVNDYKSYVYRGYQHKAILIDNAEGKTGETDDVSFTITYYDKDGNEVAPSDTTTHVKSFKIKVNIDANRHIKAQSLTSNGYPTHMDSSSGTVGDTWTVTNTGAVADKTSTATYKTDLPKWLDKAVLNGKLDGGADRYDSGATTLDYDKINGTLSYRLLLNTNMDDDGTITVTDVLPKGQEFIDGSVYARFYENAYSMHDHNYYSNTDTKFVDGYDSTKVADADSYNPTYTAVKNADGTTTLTITIKNYHYKNYPNIAVFYKVSIAKDSCWSYPTTESKVYSNTVTWGDTTEKQDTTVKRNAVTVNKDGEQLDVNGNPVKLDNTNTPVVSPSDYVRYYVEINPAGKDLDPSSDTLTLTDQMSDAGTFNPQIDLTTIHLYAYDVTAEHHVGAELPTSSYSVKYDQSTGKLTVVVPDGVGCVLSYQYSLEDSSVQDNKNIKNTVTLQGNWTSSKTVTLHEVSSSSTGSFGHIELFKVDSENYRNLLPGAEFKLDKWNTTTNAWETVNEKEAVDSNGTITWDFIAKTPDELGENTLYRLTEITAPDGYTLDSTPHYFIRGSGTDKSDAYNKSGASNATYVDSSGATKTGIAQSSVNIFNYTGGLMYISNENTRVTVNKLWTNQDGTQINAPSGASVDVNLMRYTKGYDPNDSCTVNITSKGTAQGNNPWFGQNYFTKVVKRGTSMKIKLGMWNGPTVKVTANGQDVTEFTFTGMDYEFVVPASYLNTDTVDLQIVVEDNSNAPASTTVTESSLPSSTLSNGRVVGSATLSEDNNWTYYWEHLPKFDLPSTGSSSNGEEYYYKVEEVNAPDGYNVSYMNNNGIQSGNITVINSIEAYELPETGGTGIWVLVIGGAVIAVAAGAILYIRHRKRME